MSPAARRARRGVLALIGVLLAGCAAAPVPPPLTVGAGAEPQSVILAHIYAGALRGSGAPARVRSAADPLTELDAGTLQVLPGFTGRLLARFAPGAVALTDRQVYRAMVGALPEGIAAGDYATAAEDKPAVAVTRATAAAWRSTELRAVPAHCAGVTVGALTGARVPGEVGRCRLPAARQYPDRAGLFAALRAGTIVAAWTSTADPGIPEDLVVLADGAPALVRGENVVPLYRRNELAEPQLLAINQVAGVLDTEALVGMRRAVAAGADPQAVADAWLFEHPLGR